MKRRVFNSLVDNDNDKRFSCDIENGFIATLDSTSCQPENFLSLKTNNIILFCTKKNLERLAKSQIVVSDGTFNYVEKSHSQLYTIMGKYGENGQYISTPLVYCLMKNKKKESYVEIFKHIELEFERMGLKYNFKRWLFDKEIVVVNLLREKFGATKVGLCVFHFMRTIFKMFKKIGLMELYKNKKKLQSEYFLKINRILSIYALPPSRIHEKGCQIIENIIELEDDELTRLKWNEFKNYFVTNWCTEEMAQMLSKFKEDTITTNDIEIYHSSLNHYIIMGSALGLRKYTNALLHVQLDVEVNIQQLGIKRLQIGDNDEAIKDSRKNYLKYAPSMHQRIKKFEKNNVLAEYERKRKSNILLDQMSKIRFFKKTKYEVKEDTILRSVDEESRYYWFTDLNIENVILNEIGISMSGDKNFVLNTHISTMLGYESFLYNSNQSFVKAGINQLIEKEEIKYENTFMPMNVDGCNNNGTHWVLGHICKKSKTIYLFDSLLRISNDVGERICRRIKNTCGIDLKYYIYKNIPHQTNGYDCGPFVVLYALYIIRNIPLKEWCVEEENILSIRARARHLQ